MNRMKYADFSYINDLNSLKICSSIKIKVILLWSFVLFVIVVNKMNWYSPIDQILPETDRHRCEVLMSLIWDWTKQITNLLRIFGIWNNTFLLKIIEAELCIVLTYIFTYILLNSMFELTHLFIFIKTCLSNIRNLIYLHTIAPTVEIVVKIPKKAIYQSPVDFETVSQGDAIYAYLFAPSISLKREQFSTLSTNSSRNLTLKRYSSLSPLGYLFSHIRRYKLYVSANINSIEILAMQHRTVSLLYQFVQKSTFTKIIFKIYSKLIYYTAKKS